MLVRIIDYTMRPSLAAWSLVATVTSKISIHKARLTFKSFLVDDDGIVLWSLCQTEKLASKLEGKEKGEQIKQWRIYVESLKIILIMSHRFSFLTL